jgi:hypothetical protein
MAHLDIHRRRASLKDGVALVFHGTATTKAALFIDLSEVLPNLPLFERTSKANRMHDG